MPVPKRTQRVVRVVRKERAPLRQTDYIQNANKFPFEPLKPGRYGQFYKKGTIPVLFRSIEGERALGSTPGHFFQTAKEVTGRNLTRSSVLIPQIKLLKGPELKKYLLRQLDPISTPEKRKGLDSLPHIKQTIAPFLEDLLAAIDWLEHTHKIRVDVDPEILKWVFKK